MPMRERAIERAPANQGEPHGQGERMGGEHWKDRHRDRRSAGRPKNPKDSAPQAFRDMSAHDHVARERGPGDVPGADQMAKHDRQRDRKDALDLVHHSGTGRHEGFRLDGELSSNACDRFTIAAHESLLEQQIQLVIRGLDPRIHQTQRSFFKGWIAGSSPAMTRLRKAARLVNENQERMALANRSTAGGII